jgi:copper homeostasis protein
VDTPAGLAAAVRGGADRIELCAALALSGLTPSPGLMALAADCGRPVYAMIRPRAGDFLYDAADLDLMRREIEAVRAAGLAGVVIGASGPTGALDEAVLAALVSQASGLGVTLHRAFDLVPDPAVGLEAAIGLGLERILTSGGARTALEGAETLAALVAQARGRISIMAGSGVTAGNVATLVAQTGVPEVHASGRMTTTIGAGGAREAALGFVDGALRDTDEASVAALRRALES